MASRKRSGNPPAGNYNGADAASISGPSRSTWVASDGVNVVIMSAPVAETMLLRTEVMLRTMMDRDPSGVGLGGHCFFSAWRGSREIRDLARSGEKLAASSIGRRRGFPSASTPLRRDMRRSARFQQGVRPCATARSPLRNVPGPHQGRSSPLPEGVRSPPIGRAFARNWGRRPTSAGRLSAVSSPEDIAML